MIKTISMIACLFVVVLLFGAVGCKSSVRNTKQSVQKYNRVSNINRMLLSNDIERFMLLDRPSRLTRWHVVAE